MDGCSSPDCQKRVDEMHKAVFKDDEGGCRFDIKKINNKLKDFISRKDFSIFKKSLVRNIIIIVIGLGVPAYVAFINVWAEDKVTPHKYVKKEEFQEVRIEQARLEEKYKKIDDQLKDLSRKQDEHTRTVLEAIKDIKKDQ